MYVAKHEDTIAMNQLFNTFLNEVRLVQSNEQNKAREESLSPWLKEEIELQKKFIHNSVNSIGDINSYMRGFIYKDDSPCDWTPSYTMLLLSYIMDGERFADDCDGAARLASHLYDILNSKLDSTDKFKFGEYFMRWEAKGSPMGHIITVVQSKVGTYYIYSNNQILEYDTFKNFLTDWHKIYPSENFSIFQMEKEQFPEDLQDSWIRLNLH